jgi:hypothetical protein
MRPESETRMRRADEARAAVTPDLEQGARWDDMWPLMMASGDALCDDPDSAFTWLEHAIASGFTCVDYLERAEPFLAPLREDDRFAVSMTKASETARSISDGIDISKLF